ncbi:MAG: translation initiation factor IF-3 [Nitriliruptor sp.]
MLGSRRPHRPASAGRHAWTGDLDGDPQGRRPPVRAPPVPVGAPRQHPPRRGGTSINDQQQRLNADIKVPRVRLVDADGTQVGIVPLAQALRRAREQELDLVEVAAQADPPVCRIMDYGKQKYQQTQKDKEARKRQNQIVVKEIKMRPKISSNDYGTKSGHVRRFLEAGSKVRASIMFRGREMTHTELGKVLLDRLADDMGDIASVELEPKVDGRNMVMVLAPHKNKAALKAESDAATAAEAGADEPAPASDDATSAEAATADDAAAGSTD